MSSRRVLGPLDEAALQSGGFLRQSTDGRQTQKLSRRFLNRFLNRSSNANYSDPQSLYRREEAATAETVPDDDAGEFRTIPQFLFSQETMEFIGLTAEKAHTLWQRWANWPADGGPGREGDPDDGGLQVQLIDFVLGHSVSGVPDTSDENDDAPWLAYLALTV